MGIFGNCVVLAPPGADGIAGASPAGAGIGGSTFVAEAFGAFCASSAAVSFKESAMGIRAVPDSLLIHSTDVNFAVSSAWSLARTSARWAPRLASTLNSGRVEPMATFEITKIPTTLATPKKSWLIEGIPLEN